MTGMDNKPAHKPDNPEQSRRFIEMAQATEADSGPDYSARVLKELAKPALPKSSGEKA
jgi:hypothetical protein